MDEENVGAYVHNGVPSALKEMGFCNTQPWVSLEDQYSKSNTVVTKGRDAAGFLRGLCDPIRQSEWWLPRGWERGWRVINQGTEVSVKQDENFWEFLPTTLLCLESTILDCNWKTCQED